MASFPQTIPSPAAPFRTRLFLALFWLISLALPAGMLLYERSAVSSLALQAEREAIGEAGRRWLESLKGTAGAEIQLRELLTGFAEAGDRCLPPAGSMPEPERRAALKAGLEEAYRSRLQPWLPPHDLVWVASASLFPVAPPQLTMDGGLGLASGPGVPFVRRLLEDVNGSAALAINPELAPILRFPLIFPQKDQVQGFFQVFRSTEGERGWFCAARPEGAMAAVLDLDHLDPLLGLRILTATAPAGGWELAFFPREAETAEGPGVASGSAPSFPLRGSAPLGSVGSAAATRVGHSRASRALVSPGLRERPALVERLLQMLGDPRSGESAPGLDRLVFSADLDGGLPWRVVLLSPVPEGGRGSAWEGAPWALAILILLAGGVWGAVRFLGGGGLRLSVGLVMAWACLWLVLLPLLGLRTVARQAAGEYGKTLRQERARQIHDELIRFDAGARFLEVALVHQLLRLAARPSLAARLGPTVPEPVIRETLVGLTKLARPPKPFPSYCGLDFMVAADRQGFRRSYSFKREETESQWEGSDELAAAFAPFMRKILIRSAGEPDETVEKGPPAGAPSGRQGPIPPIVGVEAGNRADPSWKERLQEESFAYIIANLVGPEAVLRLLNHPGQVTECQSSHLRVSFLPAFMHTPAPPPNRLILWGWGDWIGVNYLDWRFTNDLPPDSESLMATVSLDISSNEIFRMWIRDGNVLTASGPRRLASQEGWVVGVIGDYLSSLQLSPGFIPSPVMIQAVEQMRRTAMGRAFRDPGSPGRPLIEIMPGRLLSRFLLARVRSTEDLDRLEERLIREMTWATPLAALLALLLAWLARRRFLGPLALIQEGVRSIDAGKFRVQLHLPGGDEFGSVARAFNSMAVALDQGRILGQYVSESVRRAVRDKEFQEAARRGSRREVTVLFSDLLGLEPLLASQGPEAAFAALGRHLEAFSGSLEGSGAEIDKVIGGKILVVFDHDRLGGGESAVAEALRVIGSVRAALAAEGLTSAMGLDAGPVVAGILGSPLVREDYTVIGDTVNLAARLAALAPAAGGSQVVLSGSVAGLAGIRARVRQLPVRAVKGKNREVEAYLLEA